MGKEVEGCKMTLFTDDCRRLVEVVSVEQLCEQLARTCVKAVKSGERNHVSFDNSKHHMIALIRRRKMDLWKQPGEG